LRALAFSAFSSLFFLIELEINATKSHIANTPDSVKKNTDKIRRIKYISIKYLIISAPIPAISDAVMPITRRLTSNLFISENNFNDGTKIIKNKLPLHIESNFDDTNFFGRGNFFPKMFGNTKIMRTFAPELPLERSIQVFSVAAFFVSANHNLGCCAPSYSRPKALLTVPTRGFNNFFYCTTLIVRQMERSAKNVSKRNTTALVLPPNGAKSALTPIFVQKRNEITHQIEQFEENGCTHYRTRLECDCAENNRRDGAIVTNGASVVSIIIRCKACAVLHSPLSTIKSLKQELSKYKSLTKDLRQTCEFLRECYRTGKKSYDILYSEYLELVEFRKGVKELVDNV